MNLKRFLCEKLPAPGHSTKLSDAESLHALKVLRLKPGDCVQLLDGHGQSGIGILKIKSDGVWVELTNQIDGARSSALGIYPITLEAAILKGEAMEWMIEKATELGVRHFQPLETDHTVVETKKKGSQHFVDRWQKISDQSLKQCGRMERMQIAPVMELKKYLATTESNPANPRFWCLENSDALLLSEALSRHANCESTKLLIGPEGGFSDAEKQLISGIIASDPVSIGPLVTRAETAALYGISMIRTLFMKR